METKERNTVLRKALGRARGNAKQKERPFDLTLDYLLELWTLQDGRCAISGLPFDDRERYEEAFVATPWAPSIDRIENDRGYTTDNVRLVCMVANFALNEWPDHVLQRLARGIVGMPTAPRRHRGSRSKVSQPSDEPVDTKRKPTAGGKSKGHRKRSTAQGPRVAPDIPCGNEMIAPLLLLLNVQGQQEPEAIEKYLTDLYGLTPDQTSRLSENGKLIWPNYVDWTKAIWTRIGLWSQNSDSTYSLSSPGNSEAESIMLELRDQYGDLFRPPAPPPRPCPARRLSSRP